MTAADILAIMTVLVSAPTAFVCLVVFALAFKVGDESTAEHTACNMLALIMFLGGAVGFISGVILTLTNLFGETGALGALARYLEPLL